MVGDYSGGGGGPPFPGGFFPPPPPPPPQDAPLYYSYMHVAWGQGFMAVN